MKQRKIRRPKPVPEINLVRTKVHLIAGALRVLDDPGAHLHANNTIEMAQEIAALQLEMLQDWNLINPEVDRR